MTRRNLRTAFALLLVLATSASWGCTEEAPESPAEEAASAASEGPSAMRSEREERRERPEREMPTKEQVPIPSDFDEEAQSAVTAENYRTRLAELDEEIPEDAPDETSER